ncbi:MAG: glycosyltransferase family 4 protein [Candidatus Omnitrophota bacterium]
MTQKPLKILFVADVPVKDASSGSQRMLQGYVQELARRGHRVTVLTRGDSFRTREEMWNGIHIVYFGIWRLNALTFFLSSMINSFRHFERLHRKEPFDLVHFQQELSSLGVLLSRKSRSMPKCFSYYSAWHAEYASRHSCDRNVSFLKTIWRKLNIFLMWKLKSYAMSRCNRITVLSQFSRQEIYVFYGALHVPIRWIPGGVDIELFHPPDDKKELRKKLGCPEGIWLFLTVRNLEPRMGVDVLIDAVKKVREIRKDFRLWIGGSGPVEQTLKEKAKSLGLLDVITFLGYIGPELDLTQYYQAADAFILPTQYMEGFGLVTIEALASGVPVLGTPVGGTQEILEGLNPTLLFESPSAEAMAEKMIAWMERDHCLLTPEACRAYVLEHYTWEKVVDTLLEVYQEILKTP